ncbi:MAG: WS/DGAT domain-containing protein [Microthrixaceae bacterium]|nr:WS/DGAT domain-containing protein [Microthrixaceae bacterium]
MASDTGEATGQADPAADERGAETPTAVAYHDRMNDSDALMWNIEKDPMLRSTITTIVSISGHIDRDELHTHVERLSRAVPRLRERVRGNPYSLAPPRWEVDPNFDLDYHLRFVRAPGEGSESDVLRLAEPIAMQGFDRARPLWEMTYVDDLAEGNSALVVKIHHSVTDGVGAMRLMLELFDLEEHPAPRAQPDPPEVHVLNQAQRFIDALGHQARAQRDMVGRLVKEAGEGSRAVLRGPLSSMEAATRMTESVGRLLAPATRPLGEGMQGRSLSCHFDVLTLPLAPLKTAGHVAGGKLNDAFVTGVLLAFRHYHAALGKEVDALRISMPINIRSENGPTTAGNAFVPARFVVPADTDDVLTLLCDTHQRLDAVVHEPAYALVEPLASVLNRFPATVTTRVFGSMMRGLDFQASNVPGSPIPLYLLGHRVGSIVPFGPMAGAGANLTLLSYEDTVTIGVNVDPAAVQDPELFMSCLRRAFDEVVAVSP